MYRTVIFIGMKRHSLSSLTLTTLTKEKKYMKAVVITEISHSHFPKVEMQFDCICVSKCKVQNERLIGGGMTHFEWWESVRKRLPY